MSTAVIPGSLRIIPGEWGTYYNPEEITSALKYTGNQIRSVTTEQIEFISQKMNHVLSNRLVLNETTPWARVKFFIDSQGQKEIVFTDAKIEFLLRTSFDEGMRHKGGVYSYEDIFKKLLLDNKTVWARIKYFVDSQGQEKFEFTDAKTEFLEGTPFEQDMHNNFPYGTDSVVAQGGVHEYSYEDILKFATRIGGCNLREHIGAQLARWPNYRICLHLDLERTIKEKTLFFVVTEKEGCEVLSITSFVLEEKKTQLEREKLKKLRDEHSQKIIQCQQELEKIKIEIDLCIKQLKIDVSNDYYQKQWAELNKQRMATRKNLEFYKEQLAQISEQPL
jgi:hypothetical protein